MEGSSKRQRACRSRIGNMIAVSASALTVNPDHVSPSKPTENTRFDRLLLLLSSS